MPHFDNPSEAAGHLLAMAERRSEATRRATADGALVIERQIKLQLSRSSHVRGTPTPSNPGQPPSLISGNLRRSVGSTRPRPLGLAGWEASFGPTAVYGRIHEFGGQTGRLGRTTLPPRPYVAPGVAVAVPQVAAIFRAAWR